MSWQVLEGDCLDVLRELDAASVQTCVTSPPYWGLRDYGTAAWEGGDLGCDHGPTDEQVKRAVMGASALGESHTAQEESARSRMMPRETCPKCGAKRIDSQLGLESTPEQYVENLVAVFREVRRVLRDDGTVWLNLGDSYANQGLREQGGVAYRSTTITGGTGQRPTSQPEKQIPPGLKPKDLCGIPWRVAFALQADGWWLRSDIVWAKPNPMPESVTDRPTRSHEYIFLLTKSARYFYDADAIREGFADERMGDPGPSKPGENPNRRDGGILNNGKGWGPQRKNYAAAEAGAVGRHRGLPDRAGGFYDRAGRNRRSVWTVTTQPFPGAHFATFPPKLIEPCILAGSPPKCCGECGAPWERISETSIDEERKPARQNIIPPEVTKSGQGTNSQGSSTWGHWTKTETLGWESTCDHDDDLGSAVVLDPFTGAGTAGVVATCHGRDFVGIELNPEYAEMARERIRAFEANPNGYLEGNPEPREGQLALDSDL